MFGFDFGINVYFYRVFKRENYIVMFLFQNYFFGCLCKKWIGGSKVGGRKVDYEIKIIV